MNREQFLNYLALEGWVGCTDENGPGVKKLDFGECYWDTNDCANISHADVYYRSSGIHKATTCLDTLPENFLKMLAKKLEVSYEP